MSEPNIDWVEKAKAVELQVRIFIDGRWVPGSGGEALEKYAPRDGKLLVRFGAGEASDAEKAVATGRRAFEDGRWSKLSVDRHKEVLYKLLYVTAAVDLSTVQGSPQKPRCVRIHGRRVAGAIERALGSEPLFWALAK